MFINPKTDFAFKKIFGSEQSKDILISFLNAMLYGGEDVVADLTLLDPYQAPRIQGIKDSFLDIKATLQDQRQVIIEMQVLNVQGFQKRVLYNAAKAFSIQLDAGEDYTLLHPVVALTIADFVMFPEGKKVISSYALREAGERATYSDDLELVFVELPKFEKGLEELESLSDKWIYFLRYASELREVPEAMGAEPALDRAFEVAKQSRLTREELELLEQRQRVLHDNRNSILFAQQQGREEGLAQGIAQGLEEGREAGRLEAMREVARQLLDVLAVEEIAERTGLSVGEVEALRREG